MTTYVEQSKYIDAVIAGLNSSILTILAAFVALLKFPTWNSIESVREYCNKIVSAGNTVTPIIPGTIDDKFINGLAKITASEETFNTLYEVLQDMITSNPEGNMVYSSSVMAADPKIITLAEKTGIPITTLLAIAAFLYKMYLKWLEEHPSELSN